MNNLQLLEELCAIIGQAAHIIEEQRKALMQFDALVAEEEIAETRAAYQAIAGADEWPDTLTEGGQRNGEHNPKGTR